MSNPATSDRAAQPCAGDDRSPLAVMVATMLWAHDEAVAMPPQPAGPKDKETLEHEKKIAGLRALALDAAKAAAPYMHPRASTTSDADDTNRSHEEWLAVLEKEFGKDPWAAARPAAARADVPADRNTGRIDQPAAARPGAVVSRGEA